jgi:hypothetical protein
VDEKDEKEVVVVTMVIRYDSSAYLRLTATDVDKYAYRTWYSLMETAIFS